MGFSLAAIDQTNTTNKFPPNCINFRLMHHHWQITHHHLTQDPLSPSGSPLKSEKWSITPSRIRTQTHLLFHHSTVNHAHLNSCLCPLSLWQLGLDLLLPTLWTTALLNKVMPCAWFSSGALEVWSLRLLLSATLIVTYNINKPIWHAVYADALGRVKPMPWFVPLTEL